MTDVNAWKSRLARLLIEKSYREGDFTLTSGRKSDYYFDGKQTSLHPEGAWLIGRLFNQLLEEYPQVQAVGGPTLGADPLITATTLIAYELNRALPGFIVRKNSKGHGTNQYLEGLANLPAGAQVAVLEDTVTTGGSVLQACAKIEEAGFKIIVVCALLDRGEGGGERLAEAGYTLRSLFNRAELLQFAR